MNWHRIPTFGTLHHLVTIAADSCMHGTVDDEPPSSHVILYLDGFCASFSSCATQTFTAAVQLTAAGSATALCYIYASLHYKGS